MFVPPHEMIDQKNLTPHKHSTGAADIHNFYNRNLDISLPGREKLVLVGSNMLSRDENKVH